MDHALAVCMAERVGDLDGQANGFIERERAFELRAFDELHDEVVGSDVEQGADVGVVERGDGLGLALEPLAEAR